MNNRSAIESELIDIKRFAQLARYVNANMDYDELATGRLDAMIDMLTNEIFAMEKRIMGLLYPPKQEVNEAEVPA